MVITGVEVVLGIIKPEFMLVQLLGTSLLNYVFLILTLVKAGYIVQVFMHVKYENKALVMFVSTKPYPNTVFNIHSTH